MYFSKYNVLVDLDDFSDVSVLQNIFHGRTSLIGRALAQDLRADASPEGLSRLVDTTVQGLKDKGFIYETEEQENALIVETYDMFRGCLPQANPIRQYQILLTYDCNLRCVYCFQKQVRKTLAGPSHITPRQLDRIFEIIEDCEQRNDEEIAERGLKSRTPLIQIVGGEPLADNDEAFALVRRIASFCKAKGYDYSITTNGVHLDKYLALFDEVGLRPRDTQITMDGPKDYHDQRRVALGGKGSFDDITRSVDKALSTGLRISLRINTDLMNIDRIPELVDAVHARGWRDHREFTMYIAPVTDHSAVNTNYQWMAGPSELIRKIMEIFKARPDIAETFTMKNFRGFEYVRNTLEGEGHHAPTMWRCEATLGQYVFDPKGDVYTCFEGAGDAKARIGSYHPEYVIDPQKKQAWDDLNALDNPVCKDCKNRFVCSSGCPFHVISQGSGECLPIAEEMALAWNHYADRLMDSVRQRDAG